LNTLLSSRTNSGGHQQFQHQHQNVNNPQQQLPTSVQSIHAIAARLSRGGANAASELSKALAGMKGTQQTPPQQHQQQQSHHLAHPQQQKCAGFMNGNGGGGGGAEKTIGGNNNLQQFSLLNNNTGGGGGLQPVIGMHIAELFKKYVENNLELAPETGENLFY
jgi:hypothetical protein